MSKMLSCYWCGKSISVSPNGYSSDGFRWNPEKAHRTELQIAILDHDSTRYAAQNKNRGTND